MIGITWIELILYTRNKFTWLCPPAGYINNHRNVRFCPPIYLRGIIHPTSLKFPKKEIETTGKENYVYVSFFKTSGEPYNLNKTAV
jgi:hypothetical protein